MEDVNELLRLADALFTEMSTNSGDWDELRRRILPRMESKARQSDTVDGMTATAEFSPVAYKSLLNLASAHLLFITPMDQNGFPCGRGEKTMITPMRMIGIPKRRRPFTAPWRIPISTQRPTRFILTAA